MHLIAGKKDEAAAAAAEAEEEEEEHEFLFMFSTFPIFQQIEEEKDDADFRDQILVGKLLTRSTISTFFSRPSFKIFYPF